MFYCKQKHQFLFILCDKLHPVGGSKWCFPIFHEGQQNLVGGVAYALEEVRQIGETAVPDKVAFVGLPGDGTTLWRVPSR